MRNKSVNQVCHRKVLKKIERNLGNQLFIAAMIGISASSSLRLWSMTVFPCKSVHALRSTFPHDHFVKHEPPHPTPPPPSNNHPPLLSYYPK